MAYNCPVNCTRILNFSNPNVLYGGKVTGIVDTSASSAYNALSLNNTRVTVANWRVGDTPTVAVVAPNGGESWPAGSIQQITWGASALNTSAQIKLSYTNGTTTTTIATLARTVTSYSWTVPNTQASNWRVVVCSDVGGSCEASDQSNADFSIVAPAPAPTAKSDFNADGKTDLVWWNQAAGYLSVWYMNGVLMSGAAGLVPGQVADLNWQVAGIADFNADGKPDLLWRHQTAGYLSVWFMDGATMIGAIGLSPYQVADTNWQVVGVGDFNADGKPDLLWWHRTAGYLTVWFMNGTKLDQLGEPVPRPGGTRTGTWRWSATSTWMARWTCSGATRRRARSRSGS